MYERYGETGDAGPLLAFVQERLGAQPEQSDVVHDLLAYLAGQMIEMNKQKQVEMKGFLAWLQGEIGVPLDDLAGKTTMQAYLGDYQKGEPEHSADDLLDVMKRNARRFKKGVDPSERKFSERFRLEYEASLDKLLPLKRRLAATDRLIDQVVYRLYGLTDEEIGVVEGSQRMSVANE